MYVCICIRTYVYMYVCMYACKYVHTYVYIYYVLISLRDVNHIAN